MIVKRTVFAMQEVTAENGYEPIMEEQAKVLGEGLFQEDSCLKELERNGRLKPEIKDNWLETMITEYVKDYGEEISFNTDLIVFEKDIPVDFYDKSPYIETANTYMKLELGKHLTNRETEYRNFISKVLRKHTNCIHFKVLKICGKEYSLFTF